MFVCLFDFFFVNAFETNVCLNVCVCVYVRKKIMWVFQYSNYSYFQQFTSEFCKKKKRKRKRNVVCKTKLPINHYKSRSVQSNHLTQNLTSIKWFYGLIRIIFYLNYPFLLVCFSMFCLYVSKSCCDFIFLNKLSNPLNNVYRFLILDFNVNVADIRCECLFWKNKSIFQKYIWFE